MSDVVDAAEPSRRFDGFLNAPATSLGAGDNTFFSFGPFPEGFPIACLRVDFASLVAVDQSVLRVRAAWSESKITGVVSVTPFNALRQLIQDDASATIIGQQFIAAIDGSSNSFDISLFTVSPSYARFLVVMLTATSEDATGNLNVVPGSFF